MKIGFRIYVTQIPYFGTIDLCFTATNKVYSGLSNKRTESIKRTG